MSIREKGGGKGGGGGGVGFADPPRIFSGATLAACRTARDDHFSDAANAAELARYQGNQYLAILLKPANSNYTTETYLTGQSGQAYNGANWVNRSSSAVSDAHIDTRIATYARAHNPTGRMPENLIAETIARDTEIADAIANLKGGVDAAYDTLDELADALINNVSVSGGNLTLARVGGDPLTVDVSGLGKTNAQINALIQAALQSAVEGNTETGIDVTYASGKYNFAVTGGGTGGGITLAQSLAAILAGSNISIDRSNADEITISSTGGAGLTAAQSAKLQRQDDNPRSTPASRTGPFLLIQQYRWHSPGSPGFAAGEVQIAAPSGGNRNVTLFLGTDDVASAEAAVLTELAAAGSRIKFLKNDGTVAYEATLIAGVNEILSGQYRVNTTPISYTPQPEDTALTVEVQSAIDVKQAAQDAEIDDLEDADTALGRRVDALASASQRSPIRLTPASIPSINGLAGDYTLELLLIDEIPGNATKLVVIVEGQYLYRDAAWNRTNEGSFVFNISQANVGPIAANFGNRAEVEVSVQFFTNDTDITGVPDRDEIHEVQGHLSIGHGDLVTVPFTGSDKTKLDRLKERFEATVGASPAVLPEGTHTLYVTLDDDGRHTPVTVLVSDLTAANEEIIANSHNKQYRVEDITAINLAYAEDTRTLTYSPAGTDVTVHRIKAVGEN